jgi:putative addiction module component (TIGR02574 family)
MAAEPSIPPPGFDELSVGEQIDYVQCLWDRIAAHVDQVPLAEWQQTLLEERLKAHRNAPEDACAWPEVIDRVRERLRAAS